MPDRVARLVRRALLCVACNEALYLFAAFCSASVLGMDPLTWYREATDMFSSLIVVPWGSALCLLALERRARLDHPPFRADIAVLLALLAWIVVPFAIRFGITFNTAYSGYNHLVLFFGVYVLVTEASGDHFEQVIDWACALFTALSLALGIPAMYAVLFAGAVGPLAGGVGFGLDAENCLSFGLHYNITGMIAVCCALFSLAGFCRRRHPLAKLVSLAGFALMALCVVLSQSRTSRYALLGALALGCYGLASAKLPIRRLLPRHAAALCCALAVLVAGYAGAGRVTDAALSHYARIRTPIIYKSGPVSPLAAPALAEAEEAAQDAPAVQARPAVDATFSDRTLIWQNLFDLWKREPKRFVIGNGMGNTGRHIVQGTIHEANGAVAVHNGYLQFIADYGIIGFALLAAFLGMLAPAALRVLLSKSAHPGDRVFVMLAVSQLLTALMESQPLGAMSPASLALFFSLAVIRVRDASLRGVPLL